MICASVKFDNLLYEDYTPCMTPAEIDAWLSANDHDRPWLAAQLGMSPGSIYNSFSKGFSARTLKAIEKLMNPLGVDNGGLEVTFTAREFERIEEARKLLGIATRKLYYEEAITEYTTQVLQRESTEGQSSSRQNIAHFPSYLPSSLAAEDPGHYDSSSGVKPRPPKPKKNGTED